MYKILSDVDIEKYNYFHRSGYHIKTLDTYRMYSEDKTDSYVLVGVKSIEPEFKFSSKSELSHVVRYMNGRNTITNLASNHNISVDDDTKLEILEHRYQTKSILAQYDAYRKNKKINFNWVVFVYNDNVSSVYDGSVKLNEIKISRCAYHLHLEMNKENESTVLDDSNIAHVFKLKHDGDVKSVIHLKGHLGGQQSKQVIEYGDSFCDIMTRIMNKIYDIPDNIESRYGYLFRTI